MDLFSFTTWPVRKIIIGKYPGSNIQGTEKVIQRYLHLRQMGMETTISGQTFVFGFPYRRTETDTRPAVLQ
jgi:hypothetical protein